MNEFVVFLARTPNRLWICYSLTWVLLSSFLMSNQQ